MIKKSFNAILSFIITSICIVIIEVLYIKKIVDMNRRIRFLNRNPDYIDMYSEEGRKRIYEFKTKSNVYEEQVACNVLLLSEPLKYINGLNLTSTQIRQIIDSTNNIKELIKVR